MNAKVCAVCWWSLMVLLGGLAAFLGEAAGEEGSLRDHFRANSMRDVEEIVFAVRMVGSDGHWYANFGYFADCVDRRPYYDGGSLRRLNLDTGEVTVLLDAPEGSVRDPVVHYDAEKILFSYRPCGTDHFHLYEIDIDGSNLRQLTDGPYDDIEPTYLPDGGLAFVSSRCHRWVNCWLTQVAIVYRCDGDGSNIRPLSANKEHDNTPWVLPDGRILYQRWEYIDRSQVHYHHLWTMNPDGTGQMVYFGNQHPGTVMIDAKPIPDSRKVAAIFSPGHGREEHAGAVVVVDPRGGPDEMGSARQIVGEPHFRDVWAFSEEAFLAARGPELVLIDGTGRVETLHHLSQAEHEGGMWAHEPRPLIRRERENVIAPRVDLSRETGELILADIYHGRNMEGIEPGEIKSLLVLEALPVPLHYTGGMYPITMGGSFSLARIMGKVPVEEDGSAYMELPALRGLFFVALDEDDMAVKRMQSFLTVQPGEVSGCVGCHEQRTGTTIPPGDLLALRRPPSHIDPIDDAPEVFDFPRDIQPILDRLCVDCHGYQATDRGGPYEGGVILSGDRGPMFSHSYWTMTVRGLFSDGRNLPESNYPPRSIGSSASRILTMLDGSHHGVTASEHDFKMLRLWIEGGANYAGTYAAFRSGSIGDHFENELVDTDHEWPTTQAAVSVLQRRCNDCHQEGRNLPHTLATGGRRHIAFNLSRPEKSLMLLAPLAEEAGGWALCRNAAGEPAAVFADRDDPDYEVLLAMVAAGKEHLERIGRFDMPSFRPREEYLREMVRYGVLAPDYPREGPLDPYELDRRYWESLWHRPQ